MRAVTERLTTWARKRDDIRALAIVGSRAAETARPDSDLDVLILTDSPTRYTESDDWLDTLGHPPVIGREQFGVVSERRVRLASGLEIEFGIASPAWAATDPLDPGSTRVARDGLRALHDPDGLLSRLQAAVDASS